MRLVRARIVAETTDLIEDLGKVAEQIHNLLLIEARKGDGGKVWRTNGLWLGLLLALLLLLRGVVGCCGGHRTLTL